VKPIAESWEQQKALAFELIGYRIYAEEVRRFHLSNAQIRIVDAPARTSKSLSAAAEVFALLIPTRPLCSSLTWIVGPSYEINKEFQYLWEWIVDGRAKWSKLMHKGITITQAQNSPGAGNLRIVIEWGQDDNHHAARAVIEGKSSTVERTLQGEQVSVAVLSEAAEHPARIWGKYLSSRTWRAILPTTPKPQAQWIRELGQGGLRDRSLSIDWFSYPQHANPLYDWDNFHRAEKLAAMRSQTGKAEDWPEFAEQFLGRWVFYTGRVLPFDIQSHGFDQDWIDLSQCRIYASCDYGYEDACVALFWAQDATGRLYLFDEIYERRLTTEDFTQRIEDKLRPFRKQVAYITGDPKQPQVEHYLRRMGLSVVLVNKKAQADRAAGHRRLVDLLANREDGIPGLLVERTNCARTIAEWNDLHYRDLGDSQHRNEYASNAIVGKDHAFDAARYFAMTMPQFMEEDREEDAISYLKRVRRERELEQGYRSPAIARWAQTGISPYAA